jgi:hypothetical protein
MGWSITGHPTLSDGAILRLDLDCPGEDVVNVHALDGVL